MNYPYLYLTGDVCILWDMKYHTIRYTTLGLGLTTLLTLGAGCSSTTPTPTVTVNSTVEAATEETTVDDVVVDTTTDEPAVVEETVEATAPATQTFDIVAQQFEFTPATITVNQGDTVVLNLTTTDVPHGFSLSQFGVSATITPGKTKTVEFVADQAGSFTFSCSVVCGAGHAGMSGTLVVN